jgi:hypothetical protein
MHNLRQEGGAGNHPYAGTQLWLEYEFNQGRGRKSSAYVLSFQDGLRLLRS